MKIYIVHADTGFDEEHEEWIVDVFLNKGKAEERSNNAQEVANKIIKNMQNRTEKWVLQSEINEFDIHCNGRIWNYFIDYSVEEYDVIE